MGSELILRVVRLKLADLLERDLNLLADFLVTSFFLCLERDTPSGEAVVEAKETWGVVEGDGAACAGA